MSYFEQIREATPQETAALLQFASHLKNHPSTTNKICETLLEKQGRTHKWRSSMDLYTATYLPSQKPSK